MRSMTLGFLMAFLAVPAVADPSPIGNETPTAEQAQDKTDADTTEVAAWAETIEWHVFTGIGARVPRVG